MNRQILPAILCVVATVCNATTYYVSTTGNDENDGLSLGTAFSSLAKAVDAAGAEEAEILIAPGIYEQSAAIRVEAPLSIRGTGAAATNVVLRNTTSGQHVITLANADAELALVSLTGGSAGTGPACLGIEAGLVRDCWVTGCTYIVEREKTGGTIFMSGGRLARSVIKENSATSHSWEETFSAGVYATAGVVENCLIIGNSSKSRNQKNIETSALSLSETAQAVNCTIIGNSAQRKDSDH